MINQLAKQAHEYATRIEAFNCEYCEGNPPCLMCADTGKEAKTKTVKKLDEELDEFLISSKMCGFNKSSEQSELADIMLVCMSYAVESGYDVEKILRDKIEYNKKR